MNSYINIYYDLPLTPPPPNPSLNMYLKLPWEYRLHPYPLYTAAIEKYKSLVSKIDKLDSRFISDFLLCSLNVLITTYTFNLIMKDTLSSSKWQGFTFY